MISTASVDANPMLPPIRRRLSSTATSAIATAAPNSSTRLAWNAVRSTVIVESP